MQEIFSMSHNNSNKCIKHSNKIKRQLGNVQNAVTTATKAISALSAEVLNLRLLVIGNVQNAAQSTKVNSARSVELQNLRQKNGLVLAVQ